MSRLLKQPLLHETLEVCCLDGKCVAGLEPVSESPTPCLHELAILTGINELQAAYKLQNTLTFYLSSVTVHEINVRMSCGKSADKAWYNYSISCYHSI